MKIKIGPYKYGIIFDDKLERDNGWKGCCCHNDQLIRIDPMFRPEQQRETLMHEILESFTAIYDLKDCVWDHHLLSQLSEYITQVLTENPHIFDYKFAR